MNENGVTLANKKAGGVGISSSRSGAAVTYGAGGTGGEATFGTVGETGTANTGNGGGGGGGQNGGNAGGNGGAGIVIVRYLGAVARGTGGTITSSGGYMIHTFTSSGTLTLTS